MGCAGLSKAALTAISGQSKPFSCQKCRLLTQDQEVIDIKSTVDILRHEVSSLKQYVNQLSHSVTSISDNLNDLDKSVKLSDLPIPISSYSSIVSSNSPSTNSTHISSNTYKRTDNSYSYTTQDSKFNIVIHGVKKCPKGSPRHACIENDLNASVSVLSSIDISIKDQSIKDIFRLGKYYDGNQHPRPILVKLIRSADASNILNKMSLGAQTILY